MLKRFKIHKHFIYLHSTTESESTKAWRLDANCQRSKATLAVELLGQLTKWSEGAGVAEEQPEMERWGCEVTVSTSGLINNAAGL